MINPRRTSTESVLIGILGLYSGSVGPADRILTEVLVNIDAERSLNLLSSSDTWNSFKSNWSRYHVESISSSLESPFTLISDSMRRNTLEFDINTGTTDIETVIDCSEFPNSLEKILGSYLTYEPQFWLPIVAYCLKKVTHSSELSLLIDNSSIAYSLVCLSAKKTVVREMASYLLADWERKCQVFPDWQIWLMIGIPSAGKKSDQGAYECLAEFKGRRRYYENSKA